MGLINLTPHTLVVLVEDAAGDVEGVVGCGAAARASRFRRLTDLASAGIARATTRVEQVGTIVVAGTSVPVTRTVFGSTRDLPARSKGTMNVVSLVTANAAVAEGRTTDNLLILGETVRDRTGAIIGCLGFGAV